MNKKTKKQLKSQELLIVVGKATFKSTINKMLIRSKKIKEILKNYQWKIGAIFLKLDSSQIYINQKWPKIFQFMVRSDAAIIKINKTNSIQIIKEITHINFADLRTLFLQQNKINNIQALSWLHFQKLQALFLSSNKICQIKSLRKIESSLLQTLVICGNPINQNNFNFQIRFNQNLIDSILFQDQDDQNTINQDLSNIVKTNSKTFQFILIQQRLRVNQEKVKAMIKKKYSEVQFM